MNKALVVLAALFLTPTLQAKTLWSNYSVSYLSGSDYEVGDNSRDVYTFEYATGTTWGDSFMFLDRLKSSDGSVENYGEFSPRFKISDGNGLFSAFYVATTIEMGPQTNYLLGIGTDLNIPHFNYFQVNAYVRDNGDGDASFQTTVVWGLPIGPLYYDGFIDIATGVDNTLFGDTESQMNFTSQLKYDLAPHFDLDTKLYVGIEYVHWTNKFGIDGVDERNVNLLVKYHF